MNQTSMGKIIFITGTDTGVGKTMVSLLALQALAALDVIYLKPIQTGCDYNQSDPAFIHAHLPQGLPQGMLPKDCLHTCVSQPKAPLFAAQNLKLEPITQFITAQALKHDLVIVEGAGGLLVPINQQQTMLNLAQSLNAFVLVVGRAGLGTINHCLLTLHVLAQTSLSCLGVILVDPNNAVADQEQRENAQAITLFSCQPVHGIIPHLPQPQKPSPESLKIMLQALKPVLKIL